MSDGIEQFREALRQRGLVPPDHVLADGQIHRCKVDRGCGELDGSYLLHMDGIPAGGIQNWTDGQGWQNWHSKVDRSITDEEKKVFRANVEAKAKERDAENRRRKAEAQARAKEIWGTALVTFGHPYLTKKGLAPFRVRVATGNYRKGEIVVPIRDAEGTLHSIQYINAEGGKHNLPGGRKAGCYFTMGHPVDRVFIAEGFATGVSIYEATGKAVAVAFDSGNLLPVARALRAKYPDIKFVICADDDYRTPGNPGLSKGKEAAQAIGGQMIQPIFGENRPEKATDFNDMHFAYGLEAVKRCIEGRIAPDGLKKEPASEANAEGKGTQMNHSTWPEPLPLRSRMPALEYPLDALPPIMRSAVEEVLGSTKAPIPLAASSALCAMSLAIQPHNDVKRAEGLEGPSAVFLMTIAESGERKSTCDNKFMAGIHRYEATQSEEAKPLMKEYWATLKAWEAVAGGISEGIRSAAKSGKDTQDLAAKLVDHEHAKPEPPRVPRLIYGDASTEKLTRNLAKEWPSAGIVSSEGGGVFGAYGLSQDSVMRTLAAYDTLWDGGDLVTDRVSSESFLVHGARLTIGLQVQEATLRAFLLKTGELARGIGFLARCLIAWPGSNIGTRWFEEPPKDWPGLKAFNVRIQDILKRPVPIGEDGGVAPAMLELAPDAKETWVAFYNRIEGELADGGAFRDVRDVGSKTADNAVRIAALFHVFEGHPGTLIGIETVVAACRIAEWHLAESRRFFSELALPLGLANAARLEDWLVKQCRKYGVDRMPTKEVQQLGPNALRDKSVLDAAIQELEELGRVMRLQDGRRKFLAVNPRLVQCSRVATAIPATSAIPNDNANVAGRKTSENSDSNSPRVPSAKEPESAMGGNEIHPSAQGAERLSTTVEAAWDGNLPVEV